MHAILLMYRSLVLAVATPNNTNGSDVGGGESDEGDGGGGGFGEAGMGVANLNTKQIDQNLVPGGVKTQGAKDGGIETEEENEADLLHNWPSMPSGEWALAQSLAGEAAAERSNTDAFTAAAGIRELGGGPVGDGEGEACGTRIVDCTGVGELTPGQRQDARDIATQLDTEVRGKMEGPCIGSRANLWSRSRKRPRTCLDQGRPRSSGFVDACHFLRGVVGVPIAG